jgi:hypothetical protein
MIEDLKRIAGMDLEAVQQVSRVIVDLDERLARIEQAMNVRMNTVTACRYLQVSYPTFKRLEISGRVRNVNSTGNAEYMLSDLMKLRPSDIRKRRKKEVWND